MKPGRFKAGQSKDGGANGWASPSARCPTCGKLRYPTRKAAKRYARRQNLLGLDAYECTGFWHLGHLPGTVRHGTHSRDDLAHWRGR